MRPRIFICSPYAGDINANKSYLALCVQDSLRRGEAPWASHGFYPDHLNDDSESQRALGMACGRSWLNVAWKCAVYEDRGISPGMVKDMKAAAKMDVIIEYRKLNT